jgi:hypothetical protein
MAKSGVEYLAQHPGWKTQPRKQSEPKPKTGPLESLELKDYCEMCGATNHKKGYAPLEPAFDPSGKAKTLCYHCRIGSAELIVERWSAASKAVNLLKKFVAYYFRGEAPQFTVDLLQDVAIDARNLVAKAEGQS